LPQTEFFRKLFIDFPKREHQPRSNPLTGFGARYDCSQASSTVPTEINKLSIESEFVSGTALAAGFACVFQCVAGD